jgi:site-specific recombinase XerD
MPKSTRARPGWNRSQAWFATATLGASADAYIRYLTELGYAEGTINSYFGCVAHFLHWLSRQRTGSREITAGRINRFLDEHLPHCRCAPRCRRTEHEARAALKHFLFMLRANGTCPPPMPVASAKTAATDLAEFHSHLTVTCGLAESTCAARLRHIRAFLADLFGTGPIRISTLTSTDVAHFVTRYTQGWTPASIKTVNNSLRSYFRFKASRGIPTKSLSAALPRVALWRLATLPEVLSAAELKQLFNAFDRQTATGKRDYAIARCLLDLGLRRAEVAHLQLDDVDWRAGTLHIHSKGKRIDILPLPRITGQAITDYLRHGRPLTTRREVFVRHRPPVNAEADLDIIRNAIRYAAQRCGLQARIRGTHILRRTAACRLMQAGTPFKDIADLLRHRSLDTTTIYAKVDLPALRRVALPWPRRRS